MSGIAVRAVITVRRGSRLVHSTSKRSGEEYEIDQVTLKKRPKKKVNRPPSDKKYSFDDIINVSTPGSSKHSASASHNDASLNELKINLSNLESSMNKKFDELEGVLKVISKENRTTSSALMNELRESTLRKQKQQNDKQPQPDTNKRPAETLDSTTIRKDLESFLHHARLNKHRQEKEYFRAARALEASTPRLRSLEQNNFFTPINENLIKNFTKRGTFPIAEPTQQQDDLLFPMIPKMEDDHIHEFLILSPNDSKPIITKTNPLGFGYHKPDLVTMIQRLGDSHDKYWKQILKYEREAWSLIATEGYGNNSVLIFERFITKDDLARLKRKKWIKLGYGVSFTALVLYLLGYYFEQDADKPFIKKTIEG
jgi:hypothetical protein